MKYLKLVINVICRINEHSSGLIKLAEQLILKNMKLRILIAHDLFENKSIVNFYGLTSIIKVKYI